MTLSDLYGQIKDIGNMFNTWQIPMDKEVHLELQDDNTVKVNVNQWISVDEELPREDMVCLIEGQTEDETYTELCQFWKSTGWQHDNPSEITHWMSIPKRGEK